MQQQIAPTNAKGKRHLRTSSVVVSQTRTAEQRKRTEHQYVIKKTSAAAANRAMGKNPDSLTFRGSTSAAMRTRTVGITAELPYV